MHIRTLINFSNLIQPANTSETKVQSESSNVYKQGQKYVTKTITFPSETLEFTLETPYKVHVMCVM